MPRKYIRKTSIKSYTEKDLNSAVELIKDGCSIREAGKKFRVPYTTLQSHFTESVLFKQAGRPTKFTSDEEICLEESVLLFQVRLFRRIEKFH